MSKPAHKTFEVKTFTGYVPKGESGKRTIDYGAVDETLRQARPTLWKRPQKDCKRLRITVRAEPHCTEVESDRREARRLAEKLGFILTENVESRTSWTS
jgi:hypothetical protein